MPEPPKAGWERAGRFVAEPIGCGCMLVGGIVAVGAVSAPTSGLVWGHDGWWRLGIAATFLAASFGTGHSAFLLASGERPAPWPSRVSAAACLILGMMAVVAAFSSAGRGEPPVLAWIAGFLFLLAGAHAWYGGARLRLVLLLAAVVAGFIAYACALEFPGRHD